MQAAPLAIDTFEERGPTRSFQQLIVSSGMMETAKVLVPFVRKDARSSAAQDVSEQTPFLFVNETTRHRLSSMEVAKTFGHMSASMLQNDSGKITRVARLYGKKGAK